MTARYDIAALKGRLEGIRTEDNPALVRQKSRDFYWYSPILKRQLDQVTADVVVSPTSEAEVVRSPRPSNSGSRSPRAAPAPAITASHAAVRRHRARPLRLRRRQAHRAGPHRGRAGRGDRGDRPPDAAPLGAGDPASSLDLQHGLHRGLRRRRVRRRRLDQMGRPARCGQHHPPQDRHHGEDAARARARGRRAPQGGARLRHQRHHHRSGDAARAGLRLDRPRPRVRHAGGRRVVRQCARRRGRAP